ncbi:MBL fold metallo-hydrolase [Celeribacter neptunius]|uniref:Hydroxyacylglutathione hydrolase n=1 Tax=Celeribacter neptunius TaxID=588602 RepID=A0A1I3KKQ1_9RHOB|nr:MBL fold metallo-hydrolase [Celeribacter neptunius]SFI73062.1 hydroxyacylglutathione hydrolase [Celeribacter neptunius]
MQNRPETHSELAPGLRRILAPNPSPMTYWGTNSYLLGEGSERVLIDPGPDLPDHRAAILAALPPGVSISHILVTHAHVDHSAGAAALARETGAETHAFGDAKAGRAAHMERLSDTLGGGEGVDEHFRPDVTLPHTTEIDTGAGRITALHTPGHMGNHLCFHWQGADGDAVFSGDLIMGWSSSLISPPDGDAAAFRDSCALVQEIGADRLYPGHGAPVDSPKERIAFLLTHRAGREAQILAALAQAPMGLMDLTRSIYSDLPQSHLPAAARNTLAHLIDLTQRNRVRATPELSEKAEFSMA